MRALIPTALLLAGCALHPMPATVADSTVQYDCGGYRFSAQFMRESAQLLLADGRSAHLRQGVAANGTRYSDGTITLIEQQGVVRLELADTVHPQCVPL
jgi:membrane-bound inhibitor of C-type lysozyme